MTLESAPFGKFALSGIARATHILARAGLGIGHGKKICQSIYTFSNAGAIVDILRFGLKWRLNLADNVTDRKIFFAFREYDSREITALSKAAKNGVFVDIGANIGYYSLRLAKAGARVIALEPNPTAYQRLIFNININALDSAIVPLSLGVGKTEESLLAYNDLGSGSTVQSVRARNQVKIKLSPLAEILSTHHIRRIDALKIDVEGAEDLALEPFYKNAPSDLWPRCVVLEVVHKQYWRVDIVELLLQCGYRQQARTRGNIILSRDGKEI